MNDDSKTTPRVASYYYDAKGQQQFPWSLTDTSQTGAVQLPVGPDLTLPVIFVPGIMGSNLKSNDGADVPVWRLDGGWDVPAPVVGNLKDAPVSLVWAMRDMDPGPRQKLLHPARVVVDERGAVPTRIAGTVRDPSGEKRARMYRERGWGQVAQTSYQSFLLWLEETLNGPFLPQDWKEFQHTAAQMESVQLNAGLHVTRLKRGEKLRMPGLPTGAERGDVESITSDDLLARARFKMPVYAFGYNWLDDNAQAGILLATRIEAICRQYACQQVVVVTHSMGGLVTRACQQLPGMKEKIAGVVHGVMPASGAAVAYRRCKVGMSDEDAGAALVIGKDGPSVTAVFAQAPGALQLLPTPDYVPHRKREAWLRICDERGRLVAYPGTDPYRDIYLRRDRWWGLVREEWLAPKDGQPIGWEEYSRNITKARRFHEALHDRYHANSYVFYGDDDTHRSFEHVTWHMRPGTTPDGRPRPNAVSVSRLGFPDVRDEGRSPLHVGGERHEGTFGKDAQTSYWELHCLMQDGGGDGTVPASSGSAPLRRDREGSIRQQFRLKGFAHEPAFKDEGARQVTLYALVKIAAQARRPA